MSRMNRGAICWRLSGNAEKSNRALVVCSWLGAIYSEKKRSPCRFATDHDVDRREDSRTRKEPTDRGAICFRPNHVCLRRTEKVSRRKRDVKLIRWADEKAPRSRGFRMMIGGVSGSRTSLSRTWREPHRRIGVQSLHSNGGVPSGCPRQPQPTSS